MNRVLRISTKYGPDYIRSYLVSKIAEFFPKRERALVEAGRYEKYLDNLVMSLRKRMIFLVNQLGYSDEQAYDQAREEILYGQDGELSEPED